MRVIDVSAITNEMFKTNLFVTREFGQHLIPRFEELLDSTLEKVFIFDFSNVLYVDFSCPHEVFGHMVQILKNKPDRFVFLTGLNPSKRENIDIALSEDKIAMLEVSENMVQIRGHLPGYLAEIFDRIINSDEELTARQLADENNLKISTASSKLLALWKQGLIDRDEVVNEEGKQFVYKSVKHLLGK
jgi:DNA-binding transcriptional ArsR family regulator